MTENEAINELQANIDLPFGFTVSDEVSEIAIKALEMQDKLKQWIENYKNPEFKDVMITRDGLIDILEEFRLECAE